MQSSNVGDQLTIRPGFSGTVPIFNDVSRKKSQFSRDAHLWLGVPDLSRHWQTTLFHHINTNTYLLEPDFSCIMYIYEKIAGSLGSAPDPTWRAHNAPQTQSWTPDGLRMWRSHSDSHLWHSSRTAVPKQWSPYQTTIYNTQYTHGTSNMPTGITRVVPVCGADVYAANATKTTNARPTKR